MNKYDFFKNKRVLVTGGSGFIGGCFIRRLISNSNCLIFNIDKLSYASSNAEEMILKDEPRYKLLKYDLSISKEVEIAINEAKPDMVIHFAAESHVDRSIFNPRTFFESNILGTFNLLVTLNEYLNKQSNIFKREFIFHHVSTDEVYGSLGPKGKFKEETPYDPRSPYSASKASSDHLVMAWFHTYGFPIKISNCSNNYGPRQFPEKLIPLTIKKALSGKKIPIYGNGQNIRDWLFVEDHIDGLIKILSFGKIGEKYCIGGNCEKTNIEVVTTLCEILDDKFQKKYKHKDLIEFVKDRPGHDKRYSIDYSKIKRELDWEPKFNFFDALKLTVDWYSNN